jgi:hypothetical protein
MAITLNELNKELSSKKKEDVVTIKAPVVNVSDINKSLVASGVKEPPFDFSLLETARNIPSSAKEYGKNILTAVTSPIQTGKSILDVGSGLMVKNIPGYERFLTSIGADTPEELARVKGIASNVGEYYNQRYGSGQNILKTIQQDPVGTLGDLSTLMTGGTSALSMGGKVAPKLASTTARVGAAIEPLNIATNTLMYGATKAIPKTVAPALYESAAKWSTSLSQADRNKLTETALNEQIMPTHAGLAKLQLIKNNLKDQINTIIDDATASGVTIPSSVIFDNLNQTRQELGGFKIGAKGDLAEITKIEREFKKYLKDNNLTEVTPSQMQKFKTDIYKRIDFDKKAGVPTIAKEAVFSNMSEAAKLALEKENSAIKALNARQGSLINLEQPLQKAAGRIENRDIFGLDVGTKATAGGVLGGGEGAAVGAGLSLLDMPRPKAATALELAKKQRQGIGMFYDNSPTAALTRQLIEEQGAYNQYPGILGQ